MVEFLLTQGEFLIRIVLSAFCGAFIGYERKSRGKGAGIRTHLVVAAASALMMIISKYGFSDVAIMLEGTSMVSKLDPSRVASQIVSGVGFLGAGMIYKNRKAPQGLTTAAGIWATSGIGMALGAGMYVIGIAATIVLFVCQIILHKNLKVLRMPFEESIVVFLDDTDEALASFKNLLKEHNWDIEDLKFERKEKNILELHLQIVTVQNSLISDLINSALEDKRIKSVSLEE